MNYKEKGKDFMRFLYVAHRYHTNQAPIMKGLVERGHTVCFVSHYQGKLEDYTYVVPVVAGYSKLFSVVNWIYVHILQRKNSKACDMRLKYGFPSMRRVRKIVSDFNPDVMIIRERSVYSIFTCLACRRLGVPMILYNQSPLWEDEIKNDLPHRIVKSLLPQVRITPVLGVEGEGKVKEDGAVFVPFVMEPRLSPKEKKWFQNGKINILCVAKYEERKNILMLLAIFFRLADEYNLTLTVAGECADHFERAYKEKLERFISENGLTKRVTLLENLAYEDMEELYAHADLFVLPSTREPASVSQLEAMSFSVPAICSDTNGTSCYIIEGMNGYRFKDNNEEDLQRVILKCISDPDKLKAMGANGFKEIEENCKFDIYYEKIIACMEKGDHR